MKRIKTKLNHEGDSPVSVLQVSAAKKKRVIMATAEK